MAWYFQSVIQNVYYFTIILLSFINHYYYCNCVKSCEGKTHEALAENIACPIQKRPPWSGGFRAWKHTCVWAFSDNIAWPGLHHINWVLSTGMERDPERCVPHVTCPVTAGMDGPTRRPGEHPGTWPQHHSLRQTLRLPSNVQQGGQIPLITPVPVGHVQAVADAFHFVLLWALMPGV